MHLAPSKVRSLSQSIGGKPDLAFSANALKALVRRTAQAIKAGLAETRMPSVPVDEVLVALLGLPEEVLTTCESFSHVLRKVVVCYAHVSYHDGPLGFEPRIR